MVGVVALALASVVTARGACQQLPVIATQYSSWNTLGQENRVRVEETWQPDTLVGRGPYSDYFNPALRVSVNALAFDLPTFTGMVVSAELRLNVRYLISPRGSESYEWRSISDPRVKLQLHRRAGLTTIYDDPNQTRYGIGTVSETSGFAKIPLNEEFLQFANAAAGYRVLMEGHIASLTQDPQSAQYLYLETYQPGFAQLVLTIDDGMGTEPPSVSITNAPEHKIVKAGREAEFHVTACGARPLSYQWLFEGMPLAGETNASVFLTNVTTDEAGHYFVVISNAFGLTTNHAGSLSVIQESPLFVQQPTTATNVMGQMWIESGATNNYLRVVATGAPFPTYQWRHNGVNVSGATNNILRFNPAVPAQSGTYTVVAQNASGSITSAPVIVRVVPFFIFGPGDQTVLLGNTAYLSVSVSSVVPPNLLQWYRNGTPLFGQTNYSLSFTSTLADAGEYHVVAANSFGSVTSVTAHVDVVVEPPFFTSFLYDQFFISGTTNFLTTSALGGPPPLFFWYKDGVPIPNQNQSTLVFRPSLPTDGGYYSVVASNSVGRTTNGPVLVTTLPAEIYAYAPSVIGAGEVLFVEADYRGTPQASFQWKFNGQDLPGQTNRYLLLVDVKPTQAGQYSVAVTNIYGGRESSPAEVYVAEYPPAVFGGGALQVRTGDFAWLTTDFYGAPRPSCQWQFNGADIPGATNYVLALSNVSTQQAGLYTVTVPNALSNASVSFTLTVTNPGALDVWTPLNPRPQANPLRGVASGNGRRVAVGEKGTVVVSTDGTNWTTRYLGRNMDLESVTFGNNLFVAVGWVDFNFRRIPAILTSPDGFTWAARDVSTAFELHGVVYGNDQFVAVGSWFSMSSYIYMVLISPDGITWQPRHLNGLASFIRFSDIAFGNGRFVATSDFSNGADPSIFWSVDGVTWIPGNGTQGRDFEAVAAGNGSFVAVGDRGLAARSTDGVSWSLHQITPSETTTPFKAITFGNGIYVAGGNHGVTYKTSDGILWQAVVVPPTTHDVRGATFDGSRFTLVTDAGRIPVSTNGATWVDQCIGPDTDLFAIAKGPGGYVAVGEDALMFSPDLATWTSISSSRKLHHVIYANGMYVAVGKQGLILTSVNGTNWIQRASPVTEYVEHVIWANNRFIAVGEAGLMITSTNGIDWTALPVVTAGDLEDVAYGNGIFVAVGGGFANDAYATVLTSTNGLDWENEFSVLFFGVRARGVTFGNNQFVLVGNDGLTAVSENGKMWFNTFYANENFRSVTYAGNRFVAAGNDGLVMSSEDGHFWERHVTPANMNLRDVLALSDSVLVVGSNGAIYQSDPSAAPTTPILFARMEQGVFRLSLNGGFSPRYIIEASTNCVNWTPISNSSNSSAGWPYVDPAANQYRQRFFRAVAVP